MTKFTLQNVIFKTFILLKNNVKFSKININKCKILSKKGNMKLINVNGKIKIVIKGTKNKFVLDKTYRNSIL